MRVSLVLLSLSLCAACASVPERPVDERVGSGTAGPMILSAALAPATGAPLQPREFQVEPTAVLPPAASATWDPPQPRENHVEPITDFTAPRKDLGLGTSYTALRLGSFNPEGDVRSLDSGFWGEIGFGRRILGVLGVEAVIGYFETAGSGGAEVYGIPLLINARVSVPVLILEPYAGAGVGGVWANAKSAGFGSEDTFSAMWDAFIGIELGLAGFSVGAEYRYVQSGDLDNAGGAGTFQLEGNVFLLTGRLPF